MRIFITGGTGFVGREVVRQLLGAGHRPVCLVRDPEKGKEFLPQGVEIRKGNLLDPDGFRETLRDCQAVIHLVGILVEKIGAGFEKVHVEGTRGLVEAARSSGASRFIYMSSLGTRDNAPSRYHRSKFRAEGILKESGLDWTIFRPSVIFGPQDRFSNRLAQIIRSAPFIPIIGKGKALIQPLSVADVAACVCLSVGNPESRNKIYPLGGPERFSYEEVFHLISSILNIKKKTIHIPVAFLYPAALFLNWFFPDPPITPDQLILLQEDNVCDSSEAIRDFRLELKSFSNGLREYLK